MNIFFRFTLLFATKEELLQFHGDYVPMVGNARVVRDMAKKGKDEDRLLKAEKHYKAVLAQLALYEKHLARKGVRVVTQARCR
jgi:hypothetical protein